MKQIFLLFIIFFSFIQPTLAADSDRDGNVFVIGGTGRASDGSPTGYQGAQVGINYRTKNPNVDVSTFYYNEGTPCNNHRDGFAALAWYKKKITENITAEAGLGPYVSMNTTTVNGQQLNEKNVGALAAMAVLYRIYGSNFHIRAQYTHAQVPGSVNTDTIFVGAGYTYKEPQGGSSGSLGKTEIGAWGGNSHTTREGAEMVRGFQVEVKQLASDHGAYSVSVIKEGDTGIADRSGIVGQVWYATQADTGWKFNVGAGPYLAHDKREGKTKVLGVGSMRLEKNLTKTVKVGVTFNRVITRNDRDQDMFLFGVEKAY